MTFFHAFEVENIFRFKLLAWNVYHSLDHNNFISIHDMPTLPMASPCPYTLFKWPSICGFLELYCDMVESSSWFLHLSCRIGNYYYSLGDLYAYLFIHDPTSDKFTVELLSRRVFCHCTDCIRRMINREYISSGMNIYWMAYIETPYDEYIYPPRSQSIHCTTRIHMKIEFSTQKTFDFFEWQQFKCGWLTVLRNRSWALHNTTMLCPP